MHRNPKAAAHCPGCHQELITARGAPAPWGHPILSPHENPFPGTPWGKHLAEPRHQPPHRSAGRCAEPPALCQKRPCSQGGTRGPTQGSPHPALPHVPALPWGFRFRAGFCSARSPKHPGAGSGATLPGAAPCGTGAGAQPAPRLPGAAGAGSGFGGAASRPLSGRKRKPSGEAVPRSAAPGEAPRACGRSFGPGQGSAARPRSTWGLAGPKNPPAGSANASPNGGRSGTQGPG